MTLTKAEQYLHKLVEMRPITDDRAANNAVLDYVGEFLADQGMHVAQREYTETLSDGQPQQYRALVATTQLTKTPKFMLYAHVDVVPCHNEQLFRVIRRGDRLYGRGTSDMLSSVAAYMDLVRQLGTRGVLGQYDFGITLVSNEEKAGRGLENLLRDGFVPELAFIPDNGNDWDLERIGKGAWTVDMYAEGVPSHGSRPWLGKSATFMLMDALGAVRRLFPEEREDVDTLNVSKIIGGEAQNSVPAKAKATLDIRVMDMESLDRIRAEIARICAEFGVRHELIGFFPPIKHDMDNAHLQAFRESVKAVVGKVPGEVISTGACDAVFYDQWGVTTIVTRPPGGGEHGEEEYIEREGFLKLSKVLGHFIDRTCKIQ